MTSEVRLRIEPLNRAHDRAGFCCGVESLDKYLKHQASQDIRRRISRVFVARVPSDAPTVLGYYTLSALSIDLSALPEDMARRLPRHPLPAALIGRLAVARAAQGKGLGRMLLADAIRRTLSVSDEIGIHALVVDALDARAASFYARYGFARLTGNGRRLFLLLKGLANGPVPR